MSARSRPAGPRRLLAAALVAALALPGQAAAAPTEHDVKAAFLVNFVRFVEWPGEGAPRAIAVIEPDPFGTTLLRTASDPTLGAPVDVLSVAPGDHLPPCRIVFAPRAAGNAGIATALRAPRGTLTVGETEEFLARGGILRLALIDGRVRVEVNIDAAERSGLKLSSRLLNVATLRRESVLR